MTLLDKAGNDLYNALKPAIARGEITASEALLAATVVNRLDRTPAEQRAVRKAHRLLLAL